ncbi:MAG: SemiSWEET family transporter [Candidatus Moranbacteria bacterium]|nr:SemiSWEET family transporter [Candidatus Moranbacteria bacterium]
MPNHFLKKKNKKRIRGTVDHLVYGVVIVGPMMNLPQLFQIRINKSAKNISIITWASFALFSFIWLLYGLVHKEKPLIIMNSALILIQGLIVAGALFYK